MILFFRGKVLCPWTEGEKTFKEHFVLICLVDTLITATIPRPWVRTQDRTKLKETTKDKPQTTKIMENFN